MPHVKPHAAQLIEKQEIKGAVKKLNTQARATILWKLGLADAAKKKNEPKKAYNKQAGRKMPCTECNEY